MTSDISNERDIEDAIIGWPERIGFPGAVAIRNVRFDPGSGRVDVMLLPREGPKKLILIEAKRYNAVDAPDKVVGQLIKYYAHALKLGSRALERFRDYAARFPEAAEGHEKTTPHKIFGGMRGPEIWPKLSEGEPTRPSEIELLIALNGNASPVLHLIIYVLAEVHHLPIRLICVKDGTASIVPCESDYQLRLVRHTNGA